MRIRKKSPREHQIIMIERRLLQVMSCSLYVSKQWNGCQEKLAKVEEEKCFSSETRLK